MHKESAPYCPPNPNPTPKHHHKHFKIEAVIVSVNYDDLLLATLPHNKHIFNKVVVVTSPEDKKTQRICEWNHVECVVTDRLNTRWGKFCKGAGINEGLKRLDKDAWVVHMDADIWLPPQTRIVLEQAHLNPEMLYGTDRFMVGSYEEWQEFIEEPKLQHENKGWVHMNAFKLGTRVLGSDGYLPLGYFQMFSPTGSGIDSYPEGHTDAGREDGLFSMLWERSKRHLIPEVTCYHLESEQGPMGFNWKSRQSKRFSHKQQS